MNRPRSPKATNLDLDAAGINYSLRSWRSRARRLTQTLETQYGIPMHGNKSDPTDELFYILLTKKTRPEVYQKVFDTLSGKYKPWNRLLDTSVDKVSEILRPAGMDKVRAGQILDIAERLSQDFGRVSLAPLKRMSLEEAHAYLLDLPGVGEKSARCVLMYSLGYDISPMDTHAIRVMKRFGLLPIGSYAAQAHKLVDVLMPKGYSLRLHVNLVAHGRSICTLHKPKCDICIVADRCARLI